jgi:Cysteine dioxygenase type I
MDPRDVGRPARRLGLDVLAEIVTGLARAESLWRPHVAHDADERVRRRLLATPAYEVWLLGWTPRQSVGLHDHGDANGAFVVVDGVLVETSVIDAARHDDARRVGDLARVPAGAVHDVANRSRRNATSIHIYSEPLSAMGFYGRDGELERVEAVHEQSPLVDPPAVERVLHPARGTIRR